MARSKYLIPLAFIGVMFFTVGFALGINSYLVPLVQSSLGTSAGMSYLIVAATFSAFLLFCDLPRINKFRQVDCSFRA